MAEVKKTHCKKGIMSKCDQPKDHEEQKKCEYYKKNTFLEQCRFCRFGKYCTSEDAQQNTKNI